MALRGDPFDADWPPVAMCIEKFIATAIQAH
jgi:hypothetical protein